MKKPFYSVISNSASTAGEIMIYGRIGAGMFSDGVMAKQFVRDFKNLENNYSRINVRLNGPGGDVWEGLPIFNVIRNSKTDTHTYCDGITYSMHMIILLAGKTVHVSKGSMGMIHNVAGGAAGNSKDMKDTAKILDKHDKILISLISDKTGKSEDEVRALWMNYEDNFLTADEMIAGGLADVLETYPARNMPKDPKNMSLSQIAAFYDEQMEEPSQSLLDKVFTHVTNFTNPKNNMKYPKVFALKGIAKPSQDQLDQANAELAEGGITAVGIYPESVIDEGAEATNNVTRLTNELAIANQTIATLNAAGATANVTQLTNELATANQTITSLNTTITGLKTAATASATKITDLETQVAAFGKNPGAQHQSPAGADTPPEEDDDMATIIANMPHNRAADALTGKPKPKATT